MIKSKVFIIGGGLAYLDMFIRQGWEEAATIGGADLVQFTGGEDVYPGLYDHGIHPTTSYNIGRDRREAAIFSLCLSKGIPMAGICRGGQFLNVMCGGKMWQEVDKHAIGGTHAAEDTRSGEIMQVTSTHHQMMIPCVDRGEIILKAKCSTKKEMCQSPGKTIVINTSEKSIDPEAIWYKKEKVFCFQPHPEFSGCNELRNNYFDFLAEFFYLF